MHSAKRRLAARVVHFNCAFCGPVTSLVRLPRIPRQAAIGQSGVRGARLGVHDKATHSEALSGDLRDFLTLLSPAYPGAPLRPTDQSLQRVKLLLLSPKSLLLLLQPLLLLIELRLLLFCSVLLLLKPHLLLLN